MYVFHINWQKQIPEKIFLMKKNTSFCLLMVSFSYIYLSILQESKKKKKQIQMEMF